MIALHPSTLFTFKFWKCREINLIFKSIPTIFQGSIRAQFPLTFLFVLSALISHILRLSQEFWITPLLTNLAPQTLLPSLVSLGVDAIFYTYDTFAVDPGSAHGRIESFKTLTKPGYSNSFWNAARIGLVTLLYGCTYPCVPVCVSPCVS